MQGPRASTLAVLVAVAAALGGCGHTVTVGSDRVIHVGLEEYRLLPASIRAPAGRLDIWVRNFGRLNHNFVVMDNGVPTGSTKSLAPGQSAELALDLAPGHYSMSSTLLSDTDMGLAGTLTITG